jgi:hypothetical protein
VNSANGVLCVRLQPEMRRNPAIRQRRSKDLNAVLTIWSVFLRSPQSGVVVSRHIVHTLLETLGRMLRLDVVAARLNDGVGEVPFELIRTTESGNRRLRHRRSAI